MGKRILITCTDSMMKQFLEPHVRYLIKNGYDVEIACSEVLSRLKEIQEDLGAYVPIHKFRPCVDERAGHGGPYADCGAERSKKRNKSPLHGSRIPLLRRRPFLQLADLLSNRIRYGAFYGRRLHNQPRGFPQSESHGLS